jgi:hypothetical protein
MVFSMNGTVKYIDADKQSPGIFAGYDIGWAKSDDVLIRGEAYNVRSAQFSAEYDVSKKALAIIKRRLAAEQKALKLPVIDAPPVTRIRKPPIPCAHCQRATELLLALIATTQRKEAA